MPAVADLHRLRCALADRLGVGGRPVAADDLGSGMLTQPRRQGGGLAVGQHIDPPVGDGVDQHGRVAASAPERDIVDAEHRRSRRRRDRERHQHPQHRRARDLHPEPGQHGGAGPTGQRDRQPPDRCGQPQRAPGIAAAPAPESAPGMCAAGTASPRRPGGGPAARPPRSGPPQEDRPAVARAGHAPVVTHLRNAGTPRRASSSARAAAGRVPESSTSSRTSDDKPGNRTAARSRETPARGSQARPVTRSRHAGSTTFSVPEPEHRCNSDQGVWTR